MRRHFHKVVAGLLLVWLGQASANCSVAALQGSWQLVSAVYRDGSGKVVAEIKDGSTQSRKLIAGQHFSFVTWHANGKFEVAATGRVQVVDGHYQEQPDASSLPRLLGKTYQFGCKLEGQRWLHSGDEDGIQIAEIWQRQAP